MAETLIFLALGKYFDKFLVGFGSKDLKIRLLRGETTIRNVQLNTKAIEPFLAGLPLLVTRAEVRSLSVKVPLKFKRKPVIVKISSIEIELSEPAEVVRRDDTDGGDATSDAPGTPSSGKEREGAGKLKDSDKRYPVVEKIVDGVRLEIGSILVRVQLLGKTRSMKHGPWRPPALEIRVCDLVLPTVTHKWSDGDLHACRLFSKQFDRDIFVFKRLFGSFSVRFVDESREPIVLVPTSTFEGRVVVNKSTGIFVKRKQEEPLPLKGLDLSVYVPDINIHLDASILPHVVHFVDSLLACLNRPDIVLAERKVIPENKNPRIAVKLHCRQVHVLCTNKMSSMGAWKHGGKFCVEVADAAFLWILLPHGERAGDFESEMQLRVGAVNVRHRALDRDLVRTERISPTVWSRVPFRRTTLLPADKIGSQDMQAIAPDVFSIPSDVGEGPRAFLAICAVQRIPLNSRYRPPDGVYDFDVDLCVGDVFVSLPGGATAAELAAALISLRHSFATPAHPAPPADSIASIRAADAGGIVPSVPLAQQRIRCCVTTANVAIEIDADATMRREIEVTGADVSCVGSLRVDVDGIVADLISPSRKLIQDDQEAIFVATMRPVASRDYRIGFSVRSPGERNDWRTVEMLCRAMHFRGTIQPTARCAEMRVELERVEVQGCEPVVAAGRDSANLPPSDTVAAPAEESSAHVRCGEVEIVCGVEALCATDARCTRVRLAPIGRVCDPRVRMTDSAVCMVASIARAIAIHRIVRHTRALLVSAGEASRSHREIDVDARIVALRTVVCAGCREASVRIDVQEAVLEGKGASDGTASASASVEAVNVYGKDPRDETDAFRVSIPRIDAQVELRKAHLLACAMGAAAMRVLRILGVQAGMGRRMTGSSGARGGEGSAAAISPYADNAEDGENEWRSGVEWGSQTERPDELDVVTGTSLPAPAVFERRLSTDSNDSSVHSPRPTSDTSLQLEPHTLRPPSGLSASVSQASSGSSGSGTEYGEASARSVLTSDVLRRALDHAKVATDKRAGSIFMSDETVLYSRQMIKVNKRGRRQERIFVCTNRAVYNLEPRSLGVRRRIGLHTLDSVTLGKGARPQMLLHVREEHVGEGESETYCLLGEDAEEFTNVITQCVPDLAISHVAVEDLTRLAQG